MRTKTKLIEKDGFTFYNITDLRAEIEIGNLRTQFDDLFGGNNKEIEKSTNESFNKNWQEFFEALRPLINETVERILYDLLHDVFLAMPASFFVEDIPTPAQFYNNKVWNKYFFQIMQQTNSKNKRFQGTDIAFVWLITSRVVVKKTLQAWYSELIFVINRVKSLKDVVLIQGIKFRVKKVNYHFIKLPLGAVAGN